MSTCIAFSQKEDYRGELKGMREEQGGGMGGSKERAKRGDASNARRGLSSPALITARQLRPFLPPPLRPSLTLRF